MSSTEEVSESAAFVIHVKDYVFDNKLEIIPSGWDDPGDLNKLSHVPPVTFPSLKTFANLANIAYFNHCEDGRIIDPPEYEVQFEGFTFLAAANNSAKTNGYYAVAYVNSGRKQVILSHRGTDSFGALLADWNGIMLKKSVPQVASAISFAQKVVHYGVMHGFQVFFTGHSLGGWLAQITTFSTMYLALDKVTGYFVEQQSPDASVQMPFTVVFDSPGAYEFLFSLKQALFPQHVESTQEIGVETLPVEVFLFFPNHINTYNSHIGAVFMLDVKKVGVDTTDFGGARTHAIEPVVELLNKFEEEDAVKGRFIDYRVQKTDLTFNSWDLEKQIVKFDRSCVPLYFFSNDERKFLEGAKPEFPPGGQFEGFNLEDENISNDLIGLEDGHVSWRLSGKNESVLICKGWDRREFIPRVRHVVMCRQKGTIWWNPKRLHLPSNYKERRITPTVTLQQLTKTENVGKPLSAKEVLQQKDVLVLLVDPPGMGKSSAVTKLEKELRSEVFWTPRVIVRINLNTVQDILKMDAEHMETHDLIHPNRFLDKFAKYIKLQQTLPGESIQLYVLLDGLDEVCPLYEQIMLRLLKGLLSDIPQRLFSVQKLILTTRPHLQKLIEDQFSVKANSLLPLEFKQQVEFLQEEVGLSFEAEKCLSSLPNTARSLMENPLMLSLYAQILKSQGTEAIVNMFDLYSQFVAAKHELHVLEKEEAEPAKMSTRRRVSSMLDDNLKFYFACAVEELISGKTSDLGVEFLEQPTGKKLEELISYGLLVSEWGGGCRFKHRSFAEFFYAQLLTHEAKKYKQLRADLFGSIYEHKVNENVERFLCEILRRRQAERRGKESPESFSRSYLREEEAELYLEKERLRRLANGWINSLRDKGEGVQELLRTMEEPNSAFRDTDLCSPLKEVGGELAGADDKERALKNFYDGNLFPFLCGSSVLLSLDYSDPAIFESMKYDEENICFFLEWLCGLGDRSWVRAKVFGINEDPVEQVWKCRANSAELILMFAVRSDDICEFLSNEEISAALNSLDCVVKDAWRVGEVEFGRVRRTLEKYVDPQKLKHSLLIHLRTVDDFLFRFFPNYKVHRESQKSSFQWSWWYAEVFSREEVLSFLTEEASRVPNIHRFGWRAVRDAWGEDFQLPMEPQLNLSWPPITGKTLLDIKEGDLVFVASLWDEVERGGLKLEGGLMEVLKEMIFGDISGWKVLEMLERRLVRQRHAGTNTNTFLSEESDSATNILEQLFKSVDVGTTLLDTLQAKVNSSKDPADIESRVLFAWLPFVVHYSREVEPKKAIIQRITSIPCAFTTGQEWFGSAARSFILAHSCETPGSSSISQLIRTLLRRIPGAPDSLLKVLLETEDGELRTLIKETSPATPPTVSYTPLGPVLTCLLNKITSGGSVSTLPLQLTMGSPWNAESVAFIFTELIETSPCYQLPRALEHFHATFPPDLIKQALLSNQVYKCFESKRRVACRKHVFVNTEGLCNLRAAIRFYFVVFGEDLQWIKSEQAYVDLLTLLPVEILSVLEDEEGTVVGGFPPLPIEVRLSLVSQIEEKLRNKMKGNVFGWLKELSQSFSYNMETDWVRLLQAFHLIPKDNSRPIGCGSLSRDHNHDYQNIINSRVLLILLWVKHFGSEETRRTADKDNLWAWLKNQEKVPRGEYLHLAVEVGSLNGVKTFAWPGLLKWKNPNGKTAREVAVELWGDQHEISRFLEERFQAVRAFHDEQ